MPVSASEVDELRREGEARGLDDADTTLRTTAEIIGYLIHASRSMGADQTEQLRLVELLVRSVEMDKESIREGRNTLTALGYGPDLAVLLTRLARKAQPEPPSWIERKRPRLA
jgi:hypothetical protein